MQLVSSVSFFYWFIGSGVGLTRPIWVHLIGALLDLVEHALVRNVLVMGGIIMLIPT